MEFKDLFVKQRPPKDYVTYPPQEIPTLEKFFAERTPKTQEEHQAAAPIPDVKRDIIKKEFKLPSAKAAEEPAPDMSLSDSQSVSAQESMKAPVAQEPPMDTAQDMSFEQKLSSLRKPSTSTEDLMSIREQAASMMPERSWTDILPYLAPLAVEAIAGGGQGGGVSYGISGQALLDKVAKDEATQKSFEEKLLEMHKARKLAEAKAAGKAQKVEVDVNGKPIFTPADQAIGKQAWKSPAKAGVSPEEWNRRTAFKHNLTAQLAKMKLTEQQKQDIMDREMTLFNRWDSHKFTEGTREVASSFKQLMSIDPNNTNRIEEMAAIFSLMRSLDPKSVVREAEQAMAIGARSYEDVISHFDKILSGESKLTSNQLLNIKKFAAGLYNKRMKAQEEVDKGFTSSAESYGLNPANVVKTMSQGTPIIWKNRKTGLYDIIVVPNEKADAYIKAGAQKVK